MGTEQLQDTLPAREDPSERRDGGRGETILPRVEREGGELGLGRNRRARYQRQSLLGEGGMGEVWRTRDNDIERDVALKRLKTEMADADGVARFVDEVHIAGRLEHPNIVPVYDVGVDETGSPFFVMKQIEGRGLDAVIAALRADDPETQAAWPIERRVDVVRGILLALSYAHAQGLVHRDVKPENIIIGNGGEIVLTDWGIARVTDRAPTEAGEPSAGEPVVRATPATRTGLIVGTPFYMAPEQAGAAEGTLDARADVYAAGVVLHELVTLRHYMEGAHGDVDVVIRLREPESQSFMELSRRHPAARRVPAELVHIAHKAMSKDRSHRYQSALEMLQALDAAREGRMPVQCHVTLTKRWLMGLSRWVDRSPLGAPAALWLSGLGALAAAGYGLWSLLAAAM